MNLRTRRIRSTVREPVQPDHQAPVLGAGWKVLFAGACLVAGWLPLSVGYLPGDILKLAGGLLVAGALLALSLAMKRSPLLGRFREIPLAFFGMSLFILADRYVPGYVAARILNSPPVPGNPLASSVPGTVLVELVELLLTVAAVLLVLSIARGSLASIYLRAGRIGPAYVIGLLGLAGFYVLTFTLLSHSRFLPVHGLFDGARYLNVTPALVAAVAANGFLEELMFRGLLMSRLNLAFSPVASTMLQAAVFASWHLGVDYTSSAIVFALLLAFPLGVIGGYLTRKAGSIIPAALFHAGADLPIYLSFLSNVP